MVCRLRVKWRTADAPRHKKEERVRGVKPKRRTYIRFVPMDLPCSYSWLLEGVVVREYPNGCRDVELLDTQKLYYVRPIEVALIYTIGNR